MKTFRLSIIIVVCVLLHSSLLFAEDKEKADSSEAPKMEKNFWDDAQKFYDKSKEVSEKGSDWVKKDIQRIGDWEYKIVTLKNDSNENLAEQLNNLGKDRWEVFWVKETVGGMKFFCKRIVRTYLKHVPVGDMLKMFPNQGGE